MRVKFGCLFAALLSSLFSFCYAQTGSSTISGNVLIQNNQPAQAATVILLNLPDSSVAMSALVGNTGSFRFSYVNPGKYIVLATRLGFKKAYSPNFTITAGLDKTIASITLSSINKELKEVSIVAKKPYIEVKPGKMIINPSASIVADGQSVLEILRQSPGVRVDNNDNVSVNGRQDALVMVDGKATNLNGADLAALLKSTQGSNIDRIEVIKGGSAKYDAAGGGIINIIYKKGTNIGTNGTFNASAGYGKYYKGSTGISLNHRTTSYNIFGSYSVIANKTWRDVYTNRTINYAGVESNYNTTYKSITESLNHNFRLGTDFFLSPNQSIGFLINGIVNNNNIDKYNTLKIYNNGVFDSTIVSHSQIDRNISNINYNLNYTGKLDKAGRKINASATYSRSKRHSDEYITNTFANENGFAYRDPLLLQNLSPTKINNWSGLLAFTNPLAKGSKLDAGLKYSYTNTDNNLVFGPQVNGRYTVNTTFSNHFLFNEKIGAAYVNYTTKFGKFDFDGGLRVEYTKNVSNSVTTNEVTTRKYFNLFPTALLNYRYNDKNEFALNLTRGITRPGYDKLNPFLYFVDLYTYQAGNPYLKPEYHNTIQLSHTYNSETVTTLRADLTTGATFPFYGQDDASKLSLSADVNLGRVYTYGININTPIKFNSWWASNYDIDASYQRYVAYADYGNLNKGTADVIISSTQTFTLPGGFAAQLTGQFETATFYGIKQIRPAGYVDAGISKQIFNKMGRLSLTGTDIFKTNRDKVSINYQNVNINILDRREYRKVYLNFSYRFGKTTLKGAARHVTGNEDEQNRMKITQ
ncbi:iron complex outermembrane receptor protein [Mucilaginibacter sp. UYP25]|uniref:TonB dependent receptor n=1 Tax=unclassified Mucilaginibacter TaxID=2617802 RepID=UPI003398AFFA